MTIRIGDSILSTSAPIFSDISNRDLSNLTEVGEKHFLNKSQITNCLLEVPQNIKLELTDGVLTLKAGSKVIVPNNEVFEEVVVESNVVNNLSSTVAQKAFLFYNYRTGKFNGWYAPNVYSGSGAPSSSQTGTLWYDSTNNQLYWKSDNTWLVLDDYSLPLGIGTWDGSKWTSVDQIFNGMGYIGSTVWVDKGVKGLIPNGRNEDGSLKNIEARTESVLTYTNKTSVSSGRYYSFKTPVNGVWTVIDYKAITTLNAGSSTSGWYFSEEENKWLYNGNELPWLDFALSTNASASPYAITSFNPKLSFRAVDYNDKSEISGWAMPSDKYIDLTLGASGITYTAPANGFVNVIVNSADSYIYINCFSANNSWVYSATESNGTSNTGARVLCPIRKGHTYQVAYSGTVSNFRFIYAEGEV